MIKRNFVIIPLITVLVASLGGFFTSSGMTNGWYATLVQPEISPPSWAFGPVWTSIYILATIAALIAWNKFLHTDRRQLIIGLFVANALLNLLWTFLFFENQLILPALIEIFFLNATTIALMVQIWPLSRITSLLLLPYVVWVSFATYLNFLFWNLNA